MVRRPPHQYHRPVGRRTSPLLVNSLPLTFAQKASRSAEGQRTRRTRRPRRQARHSQPNASIVHHRITKKQQQRHQRFDRSCDIVDYATTAMRSKARMMTTTWFPAFTSSAAEYKVRCFDVIKEGILEKCRRDHAKSSRKFKAKHCELVRCEDSDSLFFKYYDSSSTREVTETKRSIHLSEKGVSVSHGLREERAGSLEFIITTPRRKYTFRGPSLEAMSWVEVVSK